MESEKESQKNFFRMEILSRAWTSAHPRSTIKIIHIKSVVFIASSSGQTGAEFPEYAASKGGMIAYMKNVALRVAKYDATSNSISPGGVTTDLNAHILESPELWAQVINEALLPKWASVEEIAQWTYFVAVINKSMTAQDILIDNGEAAKSNFVW